MATWSPATTYSEGTIVKSDGYYYFCLRGGCLGTPLLDPSWWAIIPPTRYFTGLVITAPGAGVLHVVGQVLNEGSEGVQDIVDVYLDDAAGAAGVLTVTIGAAGLLLPPFATPATRVHFQILTDGTGNFAYDATGTGLGGVCSQIHKVLSELDQQNVTIT
jgi:ethanolamine utilization microcompartment shell protein EutS